MRVGVLSFALGAWTVLAAGSLKTTPDEFVSRVTDIVRLRRSRVVPVIARFSNPPTLDDLAALTLGDEDLEELHECQPGDCGLKLADAEIQRMRAALASGGVDRRSTAQQAFREILLDTRTGRPRISDESRSSA
jgi:hypothetical protein